MAMEKDSVASDKIDQMDGCSEGEESKFFYDGGGEEYLHLCHRGSSSVLASLDATKPIVESLKMKPIIIKKVKKTKTIRIFGADWDVPDSADSEYTIVYNPEPLRCFDPNTAQYVGLPVREYHDPLDQRGGIVENAEPHNLDNFSRLLQNIEARLGVRPVLLYKKKLTKSDVSSNLNRLFITRSQELMGFLKDEEKRRVEDDDKNIWLDVLATHPTGESHELHLKLWRSLDMVVLNGKNWNTVVSKNKLEAGYFVELWAYREQDTELRLAINFKNVE